MKKVYEMALVDETKCVGDKICENVCPTGAIKVVEKKAEVSDSKCAACFKCLDACNEGAIRFVPLREPRILRIDPTEVDQDQLRELCLKANVDPEEPICLCTLTPAKEVAAAILKGAASPTEVTQMTGIRTSCGMWCMAPVLRLLQAQGLEMSPPSGYRWYHVSTALWNIPDDVARKYPEYRIHEDHQLLDEGAIDNLVSILK